MALVSFVAPVFNKDAYIGETIESLNLQTLKDIEILFIDDGSTDGTVEIIKFYQKYDKRIKLYKIGKNVGLGKAWNIGIREASSPIICVASGDDIFVKERAEITYNAFKDKATDVFYGAFWFTDHLLNRTEYKPAIPFSKKKLLTPRADGFSTQYIGHLTMAFTKKIGLKVPHREENKVGIDYPLLIDLANAGCKFRWTSKVLAYARLLKSGVSISRRSEVYNVKV